MSSARETLDCSVLSVRVVLPLGFRRIEAVTGVGALDSVATADQALAEICEVVKASPSNAAGKVVGLRKEVRELEKQVTQLKQKLATGAGADLTASAVDIAGC